MSNAETATQTQEEEETLSLDEQSALIDKMKAADLDSLREEQGVEVEGWENLKLVEKRLRLKAALGLIENVPDLSDEIVRTAFEVENIKTEKKAIETVHRLMDDAEGSYFKIGGVLANIQQNGWIGEHKSFKLFVEATFGLQYRKAMYFIQIYNDLVNSGVAWSKVEVLGWSKLKELSPILTVENVDEWVEKAKATTVLQLHEEVRAYQAQQHAVKNGAAPGEEASAKSVTSKSFKFHADQKEVVEAALDKAKQVSGTEVDSVALTHVCMEFVNSAPAKLPALSVQMKQAGIDKTLEAFEKAFPEAELTVSVPAPADSGQAASTA